VPLKNMIRTVPSFLRLKLFKMPWFSFVCLSSMACRSLLLIVCLTPLFGCSLAEAVVTLAFEEAVS
jgi:hypothetical protein